MSDPNEEVIEDVIEVPEIIEATDEEGNDVTDWKALAQANKELALKNQGIAKRYRTKFEKSKEVKPVVVEPVAKVEPKSDNLDYGQKAFLIANGVKEADEIGLVKDIMANTGKSLDDVMASKYFQAELKELRDAKVVAEAVPSGSKRTGQSSKSTVEYWIAKGELPPVAERELRQQVVNARIKTEKGGSIFTENPVVQ
jgi:hypothetical protein